MHERNKHLNFVKGIFFLLFLNRTIFVNMCHFTALYYILQDLTATKDFKPYKCYTYFKTFGYLLFNGKSRKHYWYCKNMWNLDLEQKRVFFLHKFCCCPMKYLTKLSKTQILNLWLSFFMAHLEAKPHKIPERNTKKNIVNP